MALPLPDMKPCYFCEIIEGRADRWNVLEETDLTLTLLNGRQYEIGQCMVLPRRHAPTLLDLREEEGAAVMAAARRAAGVLVDALGPDGILLYQNNGVGSGQEVPHFHLHVVPRTPGSDWGTGPPPLARLEREAARREDARRKAARGAAARRGTPRRGTPRRPGQDHVDHEAVTVQKRATVETLRRHWTAL